MKIRDLLPFCVLAFALYLCSVENVKTSVWVNVTLCMVVLFLFCNPFDMLGELSKKSRTLLAVSVPLCTCGVEIPQMPFKARLCLLFMGICFASAAIKNCKLWRIQEITYQSNEVNEVLNHIYYTKSDWAVRDRWIEYGYKETRALLRQGFGFEITENMLASEYMAAWALGFLHGCTETESVIDSVEDLQKRAYNLHAEIDEMRQEKKNIKLDKLVEKAVSDADLQVYEMSTRGKSLSQIANELGVSKTTAYRMKERGAKKNEYTQMDEMEEG